MRGINGLDFPDTSGNEALVFQTCMEGWDMEHFIGVELHFLGSKVPVPESVPEKLQLEFQESLKQPRPPFPAVPELPHWPALAP